MAVTTVGDRPQAPAPAPKEAPSASAQKAPVANDAAAPGAASSKKAEVTAQLQAERAADAFEPAAKNDLAALGLDPAANDLPLGFEDPSGAGAAVDTAALQTAAADEPPATPAEAIENLNDALTELQNLPPDAPLEQVFDTFVGALDSVLDLMNVFLDPLLPPDPAGPTDGTGQTEEPSITNPNPLGIDGPGGPGTQPGAFGVVGIDQNDPNLDGNQGFYAFGQTNCGPTSMAQIARGKSLEDPNYSLSWTQNGETVTKRVADMTNEELVSTLGMIGGTDGQGTSPNGLIDMAHAMGMDVDGTEVMFDQNWQEGQPSNAFNEQWLNDQLAQGKKVVINGAYEAPGQNGDTELVGHYMTVAGRNADGTFAVVDPWDGKVKSYTADQLAKFMQANPYNGGVMLSMG